MLETRRTIDADGLVRKHHASVAIITHPSGSGTGFVVAEGLIVTNAHVVDAAPAGEIDVSFLSVSPTPIRARRVVYEDVGRDLCLLEVETSQPPLEVVAEFGIPQGEPVVLIGNPSVAEGVVATNAATVGEMAGGMRVDGAFFHSVRATVNPGSSGGPVLDSGGRVVGVVAMKATDEGARALRTALAELDLLTAGRSSAAAGGRPAGFAFAIPASDLHRALEEVQGRSDADRARADDEHLARVMLARLSGLAALHVMTIQAHAPAGIRSESEWLQREVFVTEARLQSSLAPRDRRQAEKTLRVLKERSVALVPQYVADQLRAELESDEARAMRETYMTNREMHIARLRASEHLSETTRSTLSKLNQLVKQAENSADKYERGETAKYVQFVDDLKVQEELRAAIESLGGELEASGP